MAQNISPEHFHEVDAILQKQMKEIKDQMQLEIKRLNDHPNDASGNSMLYKSLQEQILKVKKEVVNHDHIRALDNAMEKLKNAEMKANKRSKNQDILIDLQSANAELFTCRNVRG